MRVCNICGCSLCEDILLNTTHIVYDEWNNPYEVCDACYKEVKNNETD